MAQRKMLYMNIFTLLQLIDTLICILFMAHCFMFRLKGNRVNTVGTIIVYEHSEWYIDVLIVNPLTILQTTSHAAGQNLLP